MVGLAIGTKMDVSRQVLKWQQSFDNPDRLHLANPDEFIARLNLAFFHNMYPVISRWNPFPPDSHTSSITKIDYQKVKNNK